jgi:hypothetical protein
MNTYFQLLESEFKNDFDWISPLINLPIIGLNTKTNFESRLIKFKFQFNEHIYNYIICKQYQKVLFIIKNKFSKRKNK